MADESLNELVPQLLNPLAESGPTGRWLRYERAFTDIARLREEDNPHLPMGEWERPLVKADWRKVAEACTRMLTEDTKDFQVAAWLCDAWIRTAQLNGLCAGMDLIAGIAEHFWADAWPAIDTDDTDRRVAPFVWLNAHLPLTIRLSILLLPSTMHREMPVMLLDWEQAPSSGDKKNEDSKQPNRHEIRESVKPADRDWLTQIAHDAERASAALDRLSRLLDMQLKEASPSLAKLSEAIESLQHAAQTLLQELAASAEVISLQDIPDNADTSIQGADSLPRSSETELSGAANRGPAISFTASTIDNRKQAYTALASIAAYLQSIEPHSPTPYLIQRAIRLGEMSLPDMIKEVSASAGSLDKFFELLGIAPPN